MPTLTVAELVQWLPGELLAGSHETSIRGVASLAEADEGDISFFSSPKYLAALRRSHASAVLVPPGFTLAALEKGGAAPTGSAPAWIVVENPSLAFTRLVERFSPPVVEPAPGIAPTAILGRDVRVGQGVSVGPYAVIDEGVEIGDGVRIGAGVFIGTGSVIGAGSCIYPNVTIREHSRLGRRVIVHSGTVIGSDGFGFELREGRHVKIPQTGIVQIDDDVEIGSNVSIDRARFGRTHIGEGTKIDNLVQIGHNVTIGAHSILVAQAGISGSTRLGKYVTLAGQAGIVGHIEIGDQAIVAAKAGVSKNVPAKTVVFGYPAEPLEQAKENIAYIRRLPKLVERVKKLEAELAELKVLLAATPTVDAPLDENMDA